MKYVHTHFTVKRVEKNQAFFFCLFGKLPSVLFSTRQWNLQNFIASVDISKRSIKISQDYIKISRIELRLKLFPVSSFSFLFVISFKSVEAVAWRCSVKKVFLKIRQNSLETPVRECFFLKRLQACIEHLRWLLLEAAFPRCSKKFAIFTGENICAYCEYFKNRFFYMTTLVVAPVLLAMTTLVDLLTIYFLFGSLPLHHSSKSFDSCGS